MSLEEPRAEPRHALSRFWRVLVLTISKYTQTDGELRAASFAYYAFFALFPLALLFISLGTWLGSSIWSRDEVIAGVLAFVKAYIPVGPDQQDVITATIRGVVYSPGGAGAVAVPALFWSSLRFFQALVQGVNRAWGTKEYSWWRMPLANLGMVAITASTLLLGVVAPAVMKAIEHYWQAHATSLGFGVIEYSFHMARLILPWLVLFYGLMMFYKYAPRRKTLFREVWLAALVVTGLLQALLKAFVIYAASFAKFNRLYGTLGSVVAVLMWIYLSGSMIIFGGCLCAARAELAGILHRENEEENGECNTTQV